MEKTKPKKSVRRGLVTKAILVLLSLVLLIFITTFSWFSNPQPDAHASGLKIKTSVASNFKVAVGFVPYNGTEYLVSDWSDELNLSNLSVDGETYNLFTDFSPVDLTGNGVDLFRPGLENGNSRVIEHPATFTPGDANKQYIEFDLLFKSDSNSVSSLTTGSKFLGHCETQTYESGGTEHNYSLANMGSDFVNDPIYNKSTYGDFSKDCIVGAFRMSFTGFASGLSYDDIISGTGELNETANFIWIPRPDIKLIPATDPSGEKTTDWVLSTGLSSGETFSHKYYDFQKESDNTYRAVETTYNGQLLTGSPLQTSGALSDNNVYNDNDNKYYGKVKAKLWLEGYDTEARRATAGGKFNIALVIEG